ncbi:hypothetical protein [Mangrovihabitans endophyticus]|uniref:Uncharacterized protein n=1 Tax=Mangrovihabitans endophyticus TaxID=1751298 RepID=A0A8J3C4G6_9ACTN|nr:hypothetical protein [Mangrovihabitans endophyticus]GGL13684.1 hypothetical protein GCM10012284_55620 [Mangrovihabitans endophyticus]
MVDEEYLQEALRAAAQSHQPDRAAIMERVARGRAPTRPFRAARPIGAALAVAVIAVLSMVAVRATGDDPPPASALPGPTATATAGDLSGTGEGQDGRAPTTAVPPATGSSGTGSSGTGPSATAAPPAGSGVPGAGSGTSGPAPHRSGTAPPSATSGSPATFVRTAGTRDAHSGAVWSQDNVTVTNSVPLTSLTVRISVPLTSGAQQAGHYTDAPNADVVMTVARGPTSLTYTFELRDAATLATGEHLFAAQYSHSSGRDAGGDTYTVEASARNGDRAGDDGRFG